VRHRSGSDYAADWLICETDLFSIINLLDLLTDGALRVHITLRQLEIFRAVALLGSTTAAAQSMPLSQSATSTALGEFERSLGARLFDRVGKRLLLNDNGRALLPLVLGVLDGAQHVERAFAAGGMNLSSDLRLHASTTVGNYILPKLLAGFRELLPAARFDVRIGNTLDVVTAVREFSADLGLIEGPCHAQDVNITPWLEDELVIVAAPGHSLTESARQRKLTAEELAHAPWLLREPGSGTREAVELALLPHLENIQPAMTLGSSEAIKNAAAEGLGISCLSRAVVGDLVSTGRLCILETRLPRLTRRLALIHHRAKVLSETIRRFLQYCEIHRAEHPLDTAQSSRAAYAKARSQRTSARRK
jgi:DNA-binding transcriptional LysR family regulator